MKTFGENLKEVMHNKCVKVIELSEMTGIPESTLSSYRRDLATPTIYNVYDIAMALDEKMERFLQ